MTNFWWPTGWFHQNLEIAKVNGSFAGMLPDVALLSKMYFWNDQDAVLLVAFSHTVLNLEIGILITMILDGYLGPG